MTNPTWWMVSGFLQLQLPPKKTASPGLRLAYLTFLEKKRKRDGVSTLSFHLTHVRPQTGMNKEKHTCTSVYSRGHSTLHW